MNRDTRRVRLVLTLLVLVSVTLLALDYRDGRGGAFKDGRDVANDVFGPVERAGSDVVDPIGRVFSSLGHLDRYKSQAQRLAAQNKALREQLDTAGFSKPEAAQLAKLLLLAGAQQDKILPARVEGLGGFEQGLDYVATLDVGASSGVKAGQTVISGDGLVGIVQVVGRFSSQVLCAVDPSATIGARLADNEEIGTVTGRGLSSMTFSPEDPNDHPRVGQKVVTLGPAYPGDRYAADIEIGTVSSVYPGSSGTEQADVTPAVSFASLDVVGVIISQPHATKVGPIVPPQPTRTIRVTISPAPSSHRGHSSTRPSGGAGSSVSSGQDVPAPPSPTPQPGG